MRPSNSVQWIEFAAKSFAAARCPDKSLGWNAEACDAQIILRIAETGVVEDVEFIQSFWPGTKSARE
jgi:hypothetical protein